MQDRAVQSQWKPTEAFRRTDEKAATGEDIRLWYEGLSMAAHDLKTPLAVLGGYLDVLLEETLGPLNERQRGVLQDMKQNEARLQRFIAEFLTFNSLQASSCNLSLRVSNLNHCVADIVEIWRSSFHKKGVSLLLNPANELPDFPFDYYKVQHVVSNLLDNALKFSPEGGSVFINITEHLSDRQPYLVTSAALERHRSASTVNAAQVSVSDAGPGIAPEFHQDIFRDFFRLDTSDKHHGMGLGLAIARRLVQSHGGTIWVESQPGAGSKFSLLLPLNPDEPVR